MTPSVSGVILFDASDAINGDAVLCRFRQKARILLSLPLVKVEAGTSNFAASRELPEAVAWESTAPQISVASWARSDCLSAFSCE
jgi:hypothetical protein